MTTDETQERLDEMFRAPLTAGVDWSDRLHTILSLLHDRIKDLEESAVSPPITASPTKEQVPASGLKVVLQARQLQSAASPPTMASPTTGREWVAQEQVSITPGTPESLLPPGDLVANVLHHVARCSACADHLGASWGLSATLVRDVVGRRSTSQKPASISSVPAQSPSAAPSRSGQSECGVESRNRHLTCLMERGHGGAHSSEHDGWGWCWNENESQSGPSEEGGWWFEYLLNTVRDLTPSQAQDAEDAINHRLADDAARRRKSEQLASIEAELARDPIQKGPLETLADIMKADRR